MKEKKKERKKKEWRKIISKKRGRK